MEPASKNSMDDRKKLKKLLFELSYEKKEITLASGRKSDFYFDGKQTSLHPEGAFLIAGAILKIIRTHFSDVEAVGGPTLGADPIVTAVSLTSYTQGNPLFAFIIRKEPKKHGTQAWIEGYKNLSPNMKVVLFEDVVTTGASVLKAVSKATDAGLNVRGVITLVDREEGALEHLKEQGIPLYSVFTKSELLKPL